MTKQEFEAMITDVVEDENGAIYVVSDENTERDVVVAVQEMKKKYGPMFQIRAPHHTVSTAHMVKTKSGKHASEVYLANYGLLFLRAIDQFDPDTLTASKNAIVDDDLDVVIIGTAWEKGAISESTKRASRILDIPIVDLRQGAPKQLPAIAPEDLAIIQRYRARLGERPLDPVAAGWEPEDIAAEARRIREFNRRKRNLLRQ